MKGARAARDFRNRNRLRVREAVRDPFLPSLTLPSSLRLTTLRARWRRLVSATNITISWRRRRTKALSSASASVGSWVSVSRPWLRAECPNCASTSASSRSVLASLPRLRANSRTWRGLTTATGTPAAHNSLTSRSSGPPLASITTACGRNSSIRVSNCSTPAGSLLRLKLSPPGHRATSSRAIDTSTPTITSPCAIAPPPSRMTKLRASVREIRSSRR